MSWLEDHRRSEVLASEAERLARDGQIPESQQAYALAAEAEEQAVTNLDSSKMRTRAIGSVGSILPMIPRIAGTAMDGSPVVLATMVM